MINLAKCPKCDTSVAYGVDINQVDGRVLGGRTWNCLAYSCRACHAVLSVQIDPVALNSDLLAEMKKAPR